jgi:23S rRNA (adenine2503-C2)-methyltransferase
VTASNSSGRPPSPGANATSASAWPPLAKLPEEWAAEVATLGGRAFNGKQIFRWIHARGVTDPEKMTDLAASLRHKLSASWPSASALDLTSALRAADGTRKLLVRLADGASVETVLIPGVTRGKSSLPSPLPSPDGEPSEASARETSDTSDDADAAALDDDEEPAAALSSEGAETAPPLRVTQCISTQVGCAMGCVFCASGVAGLTRNMGADEIVAQVILGRTHLEPGEVLRGVVLMGMGEPLHNYEATARALRLLTHPDGIGLSSRRVTVSTSGLVPEIDRLGADFKGQIGLAVSLHAADETLRSRLMPINRKYSLAALMTALHRYPLPKRRRITIEYTLIGDENDSLADARKLAKLLRDLPVKINLIPMNPVESSPLRPPKEERVLEFQKVLCEADYSCFIRRRRGSEVAAACGQLALLGGRRKVRSLLGPRPTR